MYLGKVGFNLNFLLNFLLTFGHSPNAFFSFSGSMTGAADITTAITTYLQIFVKTISKKWHCLLLSSPGWISNIVILVVAYTILL